jgi:hypothetical protein
MTAQYAVVAHHVETGSRDQRADPSAQVERRKEDCARAVLPCAFELVAQSPVARARLGTIIQKRGVSIARDAIA